MVAANDLESELDVSDGQDHILCLAGGVTLLPVDDAAELGACCRRVGHAEFVWSGQRIKVGAWLEPVRRDGMTAVEARLQTLAVIEAGCDLTSPRLCDELEHAAETAVLVSELRPRLAVRFPARRVA